MKSKLVLFLFPLLVSILSFGLTLEIISVERMTREADVIISGKVENSYSVWEGNNIYTYIKVKVDERIKGNDNGGFVTVKQLGGQVGEIGQQIAGTPKLEKNNNVLLFLTKWNGDFWIHSIVLGKFSITEENGVRFAENNLNNINLIDPVTKKEIKDPDVKNNKFPLTDFVVQIKNYMGDK